MNRCRSNAPRRSWDSLGIFLVLLTRKMPEVLGIDGPKDYDEEFEFRWSPPVQTYFSDPQQILGQRSHGTYNDHGIVNRNPTRYDPKIEGDFDIPWQEEGALRRFSDPFENGPNGMDEVSRENSFLYGFGQRSLDDESPQNSTFNASDVLNDTFARIPSYWRTTHGFRKNENTSVAEIEGSKEGNPDDDDEDMKIRKGCVAKIMKLENFLSICKVAKAIHGIVKEVKRHTSLFKLMSSFNLDRGSFKKFTLNSVLGKFVRDLTSSNNKIKKMVDAKKRVGRNKKKSHKKPSRKKPTTPKVSEEETDEAA